MSGLDAAPDLPAPTDDLVRPFQVESSGLRGRLVRLGPALDGILSRHDYPEPVSFLLGELVALAVVLANALKYDGVFSLQTRSGGPVTMMLADVDTAGHVRACARFDEKALAALTPAERGRPPLSQLVGPGYLSWTVDQGPDSEPYQGIVPLEGETLVECADDYFRRSEQLGAGFALGIARLTADGGSVWRAGAIMVQRIADAGGKGAPADNDAWDRARALVATVRSDELAEPGLPARDLLWRLFHKDGVRVFRPVPVVAQCRCSRARVQKVLRSFPAEEIADMVKNGEIGVTCEFCNAFYAFTEAEARTGQANPGA